MELNERVLYHQIHPFKLLTDWSAAFAAAALLWNHRPIEALVIGFVPSALVTIALVRWANLEPYRESRFGHYVSGFMTRRVKVARFGGLLPLWIGAWFRSPVAMAAGVVWIIGCWLIGLRRRR